MRKVLSNLVQRWWNKNAMAGIALGVALVCGQNAVAQTNTNTTNNASMAGTLQFAATEFFVMVMASFKS